MKKILSLVAVAAIAVSCGNNSKSRGFLQEQQADENAIAGIVVNSVDEANAASFSLEKETEFFNVFMKPGNIVEAVQNSPDIRNLDYEGKWEIVEEQYKLTLSALVDTGEEPTIIMVPKTLDKAKVEGEETEYKLEGLKLLKMELYSDNNKEFCLEESVAKDFIENMYNDELYQDERFLVCYCSPQLLKKLRDEFEYDEMEGYASWLFRSQNQDGPSERHEVIKVESEGNNWYRYDFYDMGIKDSRRIKLIKNMGDGILILDLE